MVLNFLNFFNQQHIHFIDEHIHIITYTTTYTYYSQVIACKKN